MKKFLFQIFIFSISILVLASIADVLVSIGLRHTPKNHLQTMNMAMHDSPKYDVLILGNSRGANGYDPYILDSVLGCNSYNMSVSGKAFRISDLRYRAYRRNNPAPKMILVNMDHIELSEGTLGFENYMFYPYILDTLVQPVLEMNHFSWLDRYMPMYRYRGNYKYITLGLCELFHIYHLPGKSYKGYTPNPNGSWNGEKLRKEIKNNPHNMGVSVDSSVVKIVDSFMAQAKRESVQVVMVFSPLYYQVQENLSPKIDTLKLTCEALCLKYNVPILNYQDSYINQDSIYFTDSHHLCKLGAEVFTSQLAHDLDSLQLYK